VSAIKDGGPAFPSPIAVGPSDGLEFSSSYPNAGGMALRDWFAGQAIGAYMRWSLDQPVEPDDTRKTAAARYATVAYEIADAMLAAREKEGA
jgi:hypothetical protein